MESNSVDLCIQQLLTDDYVSYLPARLVNAELRSGRLLELPVRQPKPRNWSCLLVMRADSKPGPTATAFIETLRVGRKKTAATIASGRYSTISARVLWMNATTSACSACGSLKASRVALR